MLDEGKYFGSYQGVTFYGDHEDDSLVYYLPDEVMLSVKADGSYDLDLQIYRNLEISTEESEKEVGVIGSTLELSVCCGVLQDRLTDAKRQLASDHRIPEGATFTMPLWLDGCTQLMSLDIDGICGTRISSRPSLTSARLTSSFNVTYGKYETELVYAALNGSDSHLMSASYQLSYAALRPVLDLRITADLEKCRSIVENSLDVDLALTYGCFSLDMKADLCWLADRMMEESAIVIDYKRMTEDESESALVEKAVSEFREEVLNELLVPSVMPVGDDTDTDTDVLKAISKLSGSPVYFKVRYTLKSKSLYARHILEADYSVRSAVTRSCYAVSSLILKGDCVSSDISKYVTMVTQDALWRRRYLRVRVLDSIWESGLSSLEVLVWKESDGVNEKASESEFSIPSGRCHLADLFFTKGGANFHDLRWSICNDDDIAYYYQLRFSFGEEDDTVVGPHEFLTEPVCASGREVLVLLEDHMYCRKIVLDARNVNYDLFSTVKVRLNMHDAQGNMSSEVSRIFDAKKTQEALIMHGLRKYCDSLVAGVQYCSSLGETIEAKYTGFGLYLVLDNPIKRKNVGILVSGTDDGTESIVVDYEMKSAMTDLPVAKSVAISPAEMFTSLDMTFYRKDDAFAFNIYAVSKSCCRPLLKCSRTAEELLDIEVDLQAENCREYRVIWNGEAPSVYDMKYVLLRASNDVGEELYSCKYSGTEIPRDKEIRFCSPSCPIFTIEKKFNDGEKLRTSIGMIECGKVYINP